MPALMKTISVEPMLSTDLEFVHRIDRRCFPLSWQEGTFLTELGNRYAFYFVARLDSKVVGFCGAWVIAHEAHITTLAVDPDYQGEGIGERLLVALLEECLLLSASYATLEVRESNQAAQNLYAKYGFVNTALRRNYYKENGENAIVMWALAVNAREFREMLIERKGRLYQPNER